MIWTTHVQAAGGGGSVKIPVRLSVMAGYNASNLTFGEDRKDESLGGLAAGLDFNVPVKSKKFLIGINGMFTPMVRSGDEMRTTSIFATAYAGYLGDYFDAFVGPGVLQISNTVVKTDAAPNDSINLSGTLTCAMGGSRLYFGKGFAGGFGLMGYYCSSGSYNKKVTSMALVETETTVSEKASSSGVMAFLLVTWDEERTLF